MFKQKNVIENTIEIENISKIVNDIIELRNARKSLRRTIGGIEAKKRGWSGIVLNLSKEDELIVDHLSDALLDANEQEKHLIYELVEICALFAEQNKKSNKK